MSGIVEHVAKAVDEAGTMSSYLTKDHLHEARVRAAIKATLEYLSENVSLKSEEEFTEAAYQYVEHGYISARDGVQSVLSQALKELDEQTP